MQKTDDEFNPVYMKRAIELARRGAGAVNPNPMVGAVIVKNGEIIGEGYHARCGELHAERAAFASLADAESARGAVMYVTFEPCCHYGKQPPCVDAIIEYGIRKVYCGSDDPNEKVAGKGFAKLREAGIEVVTHCMRDECDALNSIFFKYITTKRPYVTMKYAMTMDGKIATETGESKWITGEAARRHVMELRNLHRGIMVGVGTVIADDPMLTCRIDSEEGRDNHNHRNPVRIVCDSMLSIPMKSRLVTTANEIETIVVTAYEEVLEADKVKWLKECGVKVIAAQHEPDSGLVNLPELMRKLGEMEIDGVLLEGGGRLNSGMLAAGLVDEACVFVAPKVFGGADAKTPVGGDGVQSPSDAYMFKLCETRSFGKDIMLRYKTVK